MLIPCAAVALADESAIEAIVHPETNKAVLRNSLLHVEFSYQDEIRLDTFNFLDRRFAARASATEPLEPFAHGGRMQLFTQHPLQADGPEALNASFKAAVVDIGDASAAAIRIESVDAEPFSIQVDVSLRWNESIIDVTTTLANRSDQSVTIYPTDEIRFNAEFGATGAPNTDFYLFTPTGDVVAATDDITFQVGAPEPQYLFMDDIGVLETLYRNRASKAVFTRGGDWIAAQTGPSAACCAVDFQYPQGIEKIENDLIVLTSHREIISDDPQGFYTVGSHVIHGRVEIPAGESFVYNQTWSGSFVPSPVVEVKNGVPFQQRMEVLTRFNNFYFFGVMGAPIEGRAAVELLGPDGDRVKFEPLHVVNPFSRSSTGTYEVTARRPLLVSSQLSFGIPEDYDPENFPPWIWEQTRRARLVVTDEQRRILRVIDEAQEPWGIFRE